MLGHDPLANRQAQAGAPIFFRGEIGFKNADQILFFDAGTRVCEPDVDDALAGIGLDRKPASAGHGVPCIQDDVQENLLQLPDVTGYHRQVRGHALDNLDLAVHHLLVDQPQDACQGVVDFDRFPLAAGRSREIAQLPGQTSDVVQCIMHRVQVLSKRRVRGHLHVHLFDIELQDMKGVVDLMGDTGSQLTKCGKFFRLDQLGLRLP